MFVDLGKSPKSTEESDALDGEEENKSSGLEVGGEDDAGKSAVSGLCKVVDIGGESSIFGLGELRNVYESMTSEQV